METDVILAAELQCRAQVLPHEVERWRNLTEGNVDGLGLHRSQIRAVTIMLEQLLARQKAAVDGLDKAIGQPEFPSRRLVVEREMSGSHGIMAVFQHILAQRQPDLPYRAALDAADLVAAGCYRKCIEQARAWGVLPEDRFREPPLTYLNAALSPTAATRRHQFGIFQMPGEGITELKLPISVLSLPFDHTAAIWTYCSLYHEVGHPLDQDLALAEALADPLGNGVGAARRDQWRRWLREMIADVFGVLLGGMAYARSLAMLLLRPPAETTTLDTQDQHPNGYVRMFLIAAMLRQAGSAVPDWTAPADELERLWRARYGSPADLADFVAECPAVAQVLLETPLAALANHRLVGFGTTLGEDHAQAKALARWLRVNLQRPEPNNFDVRLVPAASQLAISAVADGSVAVCAAIHATALKFVQDIPPPQFLAPDQLDQFSAGREAFFRALVDSIKLAGDEDQSPTAAPAFAFGAQPEPPGQGITS